MPWDQANRSNLLVSYLKTLLAIFLSPWKAGAALALPDNWARTLRWACAHLLVVILAGALLNNYQYFLHVFKDHISPSAFKHPYLWSNEYAPVGRLLIWLGESLIAWICVLGTLASIGILLSVGLPGRHRVAKLGGVKWSLYVLPIVIVALTAWYGHYTLGRPLIQMTLPKFTYRGLPPPIPMWLIVSTYGLWWAAGMASHPCNRKRGLQTMGAYGLLYAVAWITVTQLLFPAGSLRALL